MRPTLDLPQTVAVLAILCGVVAYPLTDYDYFWHLRTGQFIFETGIVPTQDLFSHTAAGRPWLVQGAGFDWLIHRIDSAAGEFGVRAFFSALIAATWSVVYLSTRLYVQRAPHALAITLLSAAGSSLYFVARPLVVTLLCFALVLFLLSKHRLTGEKRWLLAVPPLMTLWVNAHFGFVLGLGLIFLFCVADGLERWMPIANTTPRPGRLDLGPGMMLLTASIVALGLNPAGYSVLVGTFEMTATNSASWVSEWQSPNFHETYARVFLLQLGFTTLAMMLSRRRPDWLAVLLFFSMLAAALHSVRHIPIASIALATVAASAFAGWSPMPWKNILLTRLRLRWLAAGSKDLGASSVTQLNVAIIGAACVLVLASWQKISTWQEGRLRLIVPVEAAEFIVSSRLHGRLFNDYAAGGYLIWRLYPLSRVFIDGRYNPYTPDILEDYLSITALRAGWLEKLEHYGIEVVLARQPNAGLTQALIESDRYRLVHADARFGVLIPNDGSRPDLPTVSPPQRNAQKKEN